MQSFVRPVRSALAVALALAALPAFAQNHPYSQTVFIGDSLTDSGHFRPAADPGRGTQRRADQGASPPIRVWSGPSTWPTSTGPTRSATTRAAPTTRSAAPVPAPTPAARSVPFLRLATQTANYLGQRWRPCRSQRPLHRVGRSQRPVRGRWRRAGAGDHRRQR